jgi:hypothetical protein
MSPPAAKTAYPTCRHCGKKMPPIKETRSIRVDFPDGGHTYKEEETGKILGYGYWRQGFFCTLRCGYRYAVKCIQKGKEAVRSD